MLAVRHYSFNSQCDPFFLVQFAGDLREPLSPTIRKTPGVLWRVLQPSDNPPKYFAMNSDDLAGNQVSIGIQLCKQRVL